MPPILRNAPTPKAFAEAWAREIFAPAATSTAGTNGKISTAEAAAAKDTLSGPMALAAGELKRLRRSTGSSDVDTLVRAAKAEALETARRAAGADGKLSDADAEALGESYSAAFAYLRGRADVADPDVEPLRFSERVLEDVCSKHGVDREALLEAAKQADDGNGYLTRAELERAAAQLGGQSDETGIISDIDKTVMPPEVGGKLAKAYPGVAALFAEIEFAGNGKAGDTHYVTARDPERAEEVPAWLKSNKLPRGGIETGTSSLPWVSEPEKVRDITRLLEANPDQKFILFGDSSHRDPEVYKKILAAFPDQVASIVIHKVTKTVPAARVKDMHLVENYAEAAARLYKDGLLEKPAALRVMKAAQAQGLEITTAQMNALLR